jgi:hypothetical protein
MNKCSIDLYLEPIKPIEVHAFEYPPAIAVINNKIAALDHRVVALEVGGGGEGNGLRLIADIELTEPASTILIDKDLQGEDFELSELRVFTIEKFEKIDGTTEDGRVNWAFAAGNDDLFRWATVRVNFFQPAQTRTDLNYCFWELVSNGDFQVIRSSVARGTAAPRVDSQVIVREVAQPVRTIAAFSSFGLFSAGTKIKIYGK